MPKLVGALALAVIGTLAVTAPARSQMEMDKTTGHQHGEEAMKHEAPQAATPEEKTQTPHGGSLEVQNGFLFETVFTESDVRIYVMDAAGKRVSPRKVQGMVTLEPKKGKATKLPLKWTANSDDPMAVHRISPLAEGSDSLGYLEARHDFMTVADGSISIHIMLSALPGGQEKSAHWATEYRLTPLFGMACPMHPDQASLKDGTCSKCGGMKLQPASVLYGCCPACEEIRTTEPGICQKCGMEMTLKAVDWEERSKSVPAKSDHSGHSH
jgi:hypothetical protein